VPIHERFRKLLQDREFSLHICRSTLDELLSLSGEFFQQARQFGLDECEIIESILMPKRRENPLLNEVADYCSNDKVENKLARDVNRKISKSGKDIHNLVVGGNLSAYFVATLDDSLSNELRMIANVPLFHLSHGVMLLESPSFASRKQCIKMEHIKQITAGWNITQQEKEMIRESRRRDREQNVIRHINVNQRSRYKKAKGPNPLSCRKRKEVEKDSKAGKGSKKVRRKRKRKTCEVRICDIVHK